MKILKPGKVEQRKFVCPKCGCVFSASEAEIDIDIDLYVCPQDGCHYYAVGWEDGEPYEEPVQDDRAFLVHLLGDCPMGTEAAADYLLSHGVTFREE